MTEEELRRRRRGSGAGLYVACIIPLGERESRETGRGGREENWLLSLDWEEEEVHACTRSLLRSALPRLTPTCFHGMAATTMHARVISPDRIEKV